eukprot:scaffold59693_cov63-Phaeocystis_antarctica.AAC.3
MCAHATSWRGTTVSTRRRPCSRRRFAGGTGQANPNPNPNPNPQPKPNPYPKPGPPPNPASA